MVIIFSTTLNKTVLGFTVGMETGGWEEAINYYGTVHKHLHVDFVSTFNH